MRDHVFIKLIRILWEPNTQLTVSFVSVLNFEFVDLFPNLLIVYFYFLLMSSLFLLLFFFSLVSAAKMHTDIKDTAFKNNNNNNNIDLYTLVSNTQWLQHIWQQIRPKRRADLIKKNVIMGNKVMLLWTERIDSLMHCYIFIYYILRPDFFLVWSIKIVKKVTVSIFSCRCLQRSFCLLDFCFFLLHINTLKRAG